MAAAQKRTEMFPRTHQTGQKRTEAHRNRLKPPKTHGSALKPPKAHCFQAGKM
jgi:hypothetical protein